MTAFKSMMGIGVRGVRGWTCLAVLVRAIGIALALLLPLLPSTAHTATPALHVVMVTPRGVHAAEQAFMAYFRERDVSVRYTVLPYGSGVAFHERIRALRPDLIYVWGTPAALAVLGSFNARKRSPGILDIPVVFAEVANPVGSHLLSQLSTRVGNVTGVIHIAPLSAQLATIRAYRPFQKLGYIANPAEPNTLTTGNELAAFAKREHFELVQRTLPLRRDGTPDPVDIAPLVQQIAKAGADFLYVGPSTFLAFAHRDKVTQAALHSRLPTFCATQSIVRQSGCLFGLVSDESTVGHLAGQKAFAILRQHVAPAQVRVEPVRRYAVLINLDVAQSLNVFPSLALLEVAQINRPQSRAP